MKNNFIPDDLVLLTIPVSELTQLEVKAIENLDWYAFNNGNKTNYIFISYSKANRISAKIADALDDADSPSEINDSIDAPNLILIDSCLHRYNEVDGWYHA